MNFKYAGICLLSFFSIVSTKAFAYSDMLGGDINNDNLVNIEDLDAVKDKLGDKYDNGEEEIDVTLGSLFAVRNGMAASGGVPGGDENAPKVQVGINPEPVTFGLVMMGGCSVMMSLTGRRTRQA